VHGIDRRLNLIWAPAVRAQATADHALAFGDHVPIPARAILLGEQHEIAIARHTSRAPRVDEQHEREKAHCFGFVRQQLHDEAAEAGRFNAEVVANQPIAGCRCVAFVEDQVDNSENGAYATRKILCIGHPIGNGGVADLALRSNEPLRHGGFRNEECPRDLRRRQATEKAKRQRDLRRSRKRRVTAGEDQAQPLVFHRAALFGIVARLQRCRLGMAFVASGFAPQPIDCAMTRGRDDPSCGASRQACGGPSFDRHGEGILDRFLRRIDVAEVADQDCHRPAVLFTKGTFDLRCQHDGHAASAPGFVAKRPDLDRERRGARHPARPAERGVEIVGLDHDEAADVLLAFGKGTIRREHVAVFHADDGCGAGRVQPAREHPYARALHLLPHGADLAHDGLEDLRWRRLAIGLIHAEEILRHRSAPFLQRRT